LADIPSFLSKNALEATSSSGNRGTVGDRTDSGLMIVMEIE
jgi:hypothetical protein